MRSVPSPDPGTPHGSLSYPDGEPVSEASRRPAGSIRDRLVSSSW